MIPKKVIFAISFPFLSILVLVALFAAKTPEITNENAASEFKFTTTSEPQPEELGKVKWLRKYNEAIALGNQKDKPVLILFQEVPGCSTCRNYGNNALSHPLIVEAIETLFVPLAIYNNKGGEDRKILESFGEPTWNNPVVRIINTDRRELTPRLGGDYSTLGLLNSMVNALTLHGATVPEYLSLLREELAARKSGTETATVGMYCFWTGEKELGSLDGVVSTQPGFMGGREVVTVEFNPDVVAYEDLISQAKNANCASHVYAEDASQKGEAQKVVGKSQISSTSNFRLDREPKYYLSKTHYQYVPMTDLQATKANVLVGKRQSPETVLSPRQVKLARFISNNRGGNWKSAINEDFLASWEQVEKIWN